MKHVLTPLVKTLALAGMVLAIALAGAGQLSAQDSGVKPIGLVSGPVVPAMIPPDQVEVAPDAVFDGRYFKLIQFAQIPSESDRKGWEAGGLFLVDYLPVDTYFAVIDRRFDLNRLTGQALTIVDVADIFRLEPRLAALRAEGQPVDKLVVSYYAALEAEKVIADLKAHGVAIEAQRDYSRQLDIAIDPARLEEIIALPYLQFLGPEPEEPVLEPYDHRNATGRSNYLNTGYGGLNYNGAGVVVGIGEGGTVDNLVDVKGRLTELTSGSPSSHKIGVMQNAGGAGSLDPTDRNNAWGATFLSIDNPDYAALYTSHNLRYTNHSYGVAISGGYDSTARNHDLRIASYPNHLVIYSSGNSGDMQGYAPYSFAGCPADLTQCWANITGQMKQNKNMFAIGALSPADVLTGFSSRGPMYDGRIIPQLVIEGIEGTSDAAPKVTGELAMLAQVYKAENGGAEPPSSLLRAIMMNTADDLGNPGPDHKHGYGRPNMRRAYNVIDNARHLSSSVSNGNTNSHTITVPANTRQVRVMVVWPDAAAAVNASPAIVNNLNLVVKDPSNAPYNPWVLDHTADPASLNTAATRQVDNRNTIEQVTVDDPAAGAWTIEVSGANVPSGPQTYYVTYEFLGDELHMMFPLKDHRFVSGTAYHLKWDSYGGSGTFTLAYQLDGGSWVSIVTGYDAASRTYAWTAPSVSGIHTIKFRVQRGALTSESDVNTIGPAVENFRIFSVCSDVVTLKWGVVAGATAYKVYRLGAMTMEEVTTNITFSGASATLTGQSTTGSEYYAVSAVTGTYEGQRTMAVEKAPGDYSCGGVNWTGAVSTDWFVAGNWSSNSVPTSADNVVIPAAPSNQPQINAAGAVCNNITIDSGASLTMNGATAYTLSVYGDWINNGTFTRGIGTVDFAGTNAYQEIGGTATTNFNILSVTKGARDRILEATSLITLNAAANPLVLASGTFKLSSASTLSPFTSGPSIGSTAGFWNNGGTINAGNYGWTLNAGLLRISAGTVNVGTSSGNGITYLNNGTLIMKGGALNIAGRFSPNSGTSTATFTQSGGVITVNTVGTTNTARAPFELNSGVPFTMNGGIIAIRRSSSNTTADIIVLSTSSEVTGGTLQIGDASTPAAQTIRINSTAPIYNLAVNATNSPMAQLVTNPLTVKNDVTISGGTLNANGLTMNVGGNWTNNGTFTHGNGAVHFNGSGAQAIGGSSISSFFDIFFEVSSSVTGPAGNMNVAGNWTNNGSYIHNGGTVTFNGTTAQTIGGGADTAFAHLTINNAAGVSLHRPALVNNQLTLTNGLLTLGSNNLTMGASAPAISGAFSDARMVVADGAGALCKQFAGNGSFNYPIGDATGTAEYSPVTSFSVSGSNYDNAAVCFRVTDDVHPNKPAGGTSYITRYWTGTQSGTIDGLSYGATFNFQSGDVVGAEAMNGKKWDGGPAWTELGAVSGTSFSASGQTGFSAFTAFKSGVLAVTLADFSAAQQGDHILVAWETASEIDNRGFNLHRGTSPAGPDRQLNTALIPSQSPGSPGGFLYAWDDSADLVPGSTYYYWLESVDVYGATAFHGPVSTPFVVPTAITLERLAAEATAPSPALPGALILAALLAAGVGLAVQRRRASA